MPFSKYVKVMGPSQKLFESEPFTSKAAKVRKSYHPSFGAFDHF